MEVAMPYAELQDVEAAYEGTLTDDDTPRVEYLLRIASARLTALVPTLPSRAATSEDLADLAKDVVVQAVLRRLRNPSETTTVTTQSQGPFSVSTAERTGVALRNGFFLEEDLLLLRPVGTAIPGSIRLGRPRWWLQ